ncbi:hypothetical protein PGR6_35520 [Pseudomonas sp. GR 6-02]|nr:hypothetical protein PGR6_35520 [Pseudomonas sp. GR 6-02]
MPGDVPNWRLNAPAQSRVTPPVAGYRQVADPSDVARAVLAASTWSVLA